MVLRATNQKAKEIIVSCLNDLLDDELMKSDNPEKHPDFDPDMIIALQRQTKRIKESLFYGEVQ